MTGSISNCSSGAAPLWADQIGCTEQLRQAVKLAYANLQDKHFPKVIDTCLDGFKYNCQDWKLKIKLLTCFAAACKEMGNWDLLINTCDDLLGSASDDGFEDCLLCAICTGFQAKRQPEQMIAKCQGRFTDRSSQGVPSARLEICCMLGKALLDTKRYEEAIAISERGLKIDCSDPKKRAEIYFRLANGYYCAKKCKEAEGYCEQGLQLSIPEDLRIELVWLKARICFELANECLDKQEYKEAVAYCQQWIENSSIVPRYKAHFCCSVAFAYYKLEEYHFALNACDKGLELMVSLPDANEQLMRWFYNTKMMIYYARAKVHFRKQEYAAAQECCNQVFHIANAHALPIWQDLHVLHRLSTSNIVEIKKEGG